MKLSGIALLFAVPLALAQTPADAKTWVLAVGISQYQKLPKDLWLQYADIDARAFSERIAVPPAQTLVLTNRQATASAVRAAFQTFLKNGPGKSDTVFLFIAGHGTVDNSGAYILAWDSDPQNLAATALPMGEIRGLVQQEVTAAAHVVFLADVCRAATIAGEKTESLGAAVEGVGESQGEMLGLMAARPRELSFEGPEFGGGHGAFTYSVLKALEGAADENHDGFVTAGELIDFVTEDVPKLTRNKQHPRDFGNMDNATQLAAVQIK